MNDTVRDRLNGAELQVVRLGLAYYTAPEIAQAIGYSLSTVKRYKRLAVRAAGLDSWPELLRHAQAEGISPQR